MAQTVKRKKMTELERIQEIIFKHGGRQISKKELAEIKAGMKTAPKPKKNASRKVL